MYVWPRACHPLSPLLPREWGESLVVVAACVRCLGGVSEGRAARCLCTAREGVATVRTASFTRGAFPHLAPDSEQTLSLFVPFVCKILILYYMWAVNTDDLGHCRSIDEIQKQTLALDEACLC